MAGRIALCLQCRRSGDLIIYGLVWDERHGVEQRDGSRIELMRTDCGTNARAQVLEFDKCLSGTELAEVY